MSERGKFIVFEGIDGCGKTTHTELLRKYIAEKTGKKCIIEREPDSRDIIGAIIRSSLYGGVKISPDAMSYMHVADRLEHVEYMLPLLEEGTNIIEDRYYVSTMAYNVTPHMSVEQLYELNRPVREQLNPDVVIFLDVPPEVTARRRAAERSDEELYDAMEKQIKIHDNYMKALDILSRDGIKVVRIDATRAMADVAEDVKRAVEL